MDVLGVMNFLNGVGGTIVKWGAPIVFGGYILKKIQDEVAKVRAGIVLEVNAKIKDINDPDIQEIVRHAIRYAAHRMPDASKSAQVAAVVKAVQDATPNWIISDDQVKQIIESLWDGTLSDMANA